MYSRLCYTAQLTSRLPSISHQFVRQFSVPGKMSSPQNSRLKRGSGIDRETRMHDVASECPKVYDEEECPTLSESISYVPESKRKIKIDLRTQHKQGLQDRPGSPGPSQHEASPMTNVRIKEEQSSLPRSFGKKRLLSPTRIHKHHQTQSEYFVDAGKTDSNLGLPVPEPFDICNPRLGGSFMPVASLNAKNKENEMGLEDSRPKPGEVIRPGMVLLTSFLTLDEQVQIVKICQELGLGSGGFYRPGYKDGSKLRLMMMCLGLDWDPQTRAYRKQRGVNGPEPPSIPCNFKLLVKRALEVSHALIKESMGGSNVEEILPNMSPDICIVNFYTTSGRLGLHQDRDESKESLSKGLPVVSLSIGDSAEFLYGDQRDVDKADRVLLQSGDILIFGGKSRHIFHGVPSIVPDSAPTALLKATNLRAGRLNLTFRQY